MASKISIGGEQVMFSRYVLRNTNTVSVLHVHCWPMWTFWDGRHAGDIALMSHALKLSSPPSILQYVYQGLFW